MLNQSINKIINKIRLQNGLNLVFQLFKVLNISILFILLFSFWLSFVDFPDLGKGLVWLIYLIWIFVFLRAHFLGFIKSFFPNGLSVAVWIHQFAAEYPDLNVLLSAFYLDKKFQKESKPIIKLAYQQKIEKFNFPEIQTQMPVFKRQLVIFTMLMIGSLSIMTLNRDIFTRSLAELFFIKSDVTDLFNNQVSFDRDFYKTVEKESLLMTGKLHDISRPYDISLNVKSFDHNIYQNSKVEISGQNFRTTIDLPKGKYYAIIELKALKNSIAGRDTTVITVLEKPFIKYYNVGISPPSYTALKEFGQKDRGNLVLLPGSRIRINGLANKKIKNSRIILNSSRFYAMKNSGKQFSGQFTARNDSIWNISIFDNDSLWFHSSPNFMISYLEDAPPSIQLNEPQGDIKLFDIDILPINYKIEDDFGISRVIIKYRVTRPGLPLEDFQELTICENERILPKQKQYRWDLSSLGVFAGEKIEYFLGAWDNDEVSGFKYAQTDTFRIFIPSLFENIISEQQQNSEIDNQLQKISKMAGMIKKKMADLQRKLKQKEKFDFKLKSDSREQLKNQQQMINEIEKLSKKIDEKLAELEKKDALSEETVEKYQEIQQMLQDILPPDIKEKLKKMQDLLDKEDAKNLSKTLSDFDKSKFAQEIDRIHELLKKMEKEQRLEDLKNSLFNLAEEQKNISDSLKIKKWQQAGVKEAQLNIDFDAVKLLIKMVEKDFKDDQMSGNPGQRQKLSGEKSDSLKKELNKLEKSISEKRKNSEEKSNSLSHSFSALAGEVKQMQDQFQKSSKKAILDKLDNILSQTYNVSTEQEHHNLQAKKINAFSHSQLKLSKRQAQLASQLDLLKKELIDIGNESFLLQSGVFSRAENARKKMLDAAEQLSQKRVASARNFQNQAMIETNLLYFQLLQSMKNIQNSQSGSGAESFMQMMQQLAGAQGKLNNDGMQMLQAGGGSQADLQRMGARQRAIKNALQDAMGQNGSSESTGRMNEVVDEMERISKLLDSGRLDAKIIKRQQKIFDRMLDSQKSLRQKEKSKKRESEQAKPYLVIKPHEAVQRQDQRIWENYFRKLLKQQFQDQTLKQMRQYYEKID